MKMGDILHRVGHLAGQSEGATSESPASDCLVNRFLANIFTASQWFALGSHIEWRQARPGVFCCFQLITGENRNVIIVSELRVHPKHTINQCKCKWRSITYPDSDDSYNRDITFPMGNQCCDNRNQPPIQDHGEMIVDHAKSTLPQSRLKLKE